MSRILTTHTSNSHSRPRCGWFRPSPRDTGTSVCVRLVCATGLRERGSGTMTNRAHEQALRTGHTCGDANDTTEPHTIASYIQHIMPARKLVCCSRGLGLLTSPVGVESQRPETTKALHNNRFLVRDHLRDITRHHVIVVTKFVVVGASWTSIGRSALVGLLRATLPVRSPVTHSHIVPHRTTFAQDCHRSSHATQADFVINGSPVLRDRVRTCHSRIPPCGNHKASHLRLRHRTRLVCYSHRHASTAGLRGLDWV